MRFREVYDQASKLSRPERIRGKDQTEQAKIAVDVDDRSNNGQKISIVVEVEEINEICFSPIEPKAFARVVLDANSQKLAGFKSIWCEVAGLAEDAVTQNRLMDALYDLEIPDKVLKFLVMDAIGEGSQPEAPPIKTENNQTNQQDDDQSALGCEERKILQQLNQLVERGKLSREAGVTDEQIIKALLHPTELIKSEAPSVKSTNQCPIFLPTEVKLEEIQTKFEWAESEKVDSIQQMTLLF
jgi:hypothetical protein